jgi:hypothetical protein
MATFEQLLIRLKKVKSEKYIKTHRKGPTGIGKTLEDRLGIAENNIPGPDGELVELKSERKNTGSMVTLFTKAPLPKKVNGLLLKRFGYVTEESKGKKVLHSTINAIAYNQLRNRQGFKAKVNDNRIEILFNSEVVCYWDKSTLEKTFARKLPRLFYVKADSRGEGETEEFWYSEAWLLSGFSFKNFVKLLNEGKILIDIRIGQYQDGSTHDHGTGFRVFPDNFELCFSVRNQVL